MLILNLIYIITPCIFTFLITLPHILGCRVYLQYLLYLENTKIIFLYLFTFDGAVLQLDRSRPMGGPDRQIANSDRSEP